MRRSVGLKEFCMHTLIVKGEILNWHRVRTPTRPMRQLAPISTGHGSGHGLPSSPDQLSSLWLKSGCVIAESAGVWC
jgi:hypothetical protein